MAEIVKSTDAHLIEILEWLQKEEAESGTGFFCNRNIIGRAHSDGFLDVLIADGNAVAFLSSSNFGMDILEVHPAYRGKGFGKALAQNGIKQLMARDVAIVNIECRPETSIPFWQRMGFQLIGDGRHALLRLEKELPIEPDGSSIDVVVRLCPESRSWDDTVTPEMEWSPEARYSEKRGITLSKRIALGESRSEAGEPVIQIIINGEEKLLSKAKYDKAEAAGVKRDIGGSFYIDRIDGSLAI